MKTFGHSVAVVTTGKDAVEDIPKSEAKAGEILARASVEQMKSLHVLGYRVDADSYEPFRRETSDTIVLGYTMKARQTVPLLKRIVQAVRRG